jgi:DNA-binding MarR family transcriptional regulator
MDISLHYLTMANQMLIQKRLLERVKASGLTLGQPKVLDYLKNHDGASQKEIAAGCFIEAGSLTSILNRMEEKGLIERRMLNGNRRTFHIFMTESGKKSQKLVEENQRLSVPGSRFCHKSLKCVAIVFLCVVLFQECI